MSRLYLVITTIFFANLALAGNSKVDGTNYVPTNWYGTLKFSFPSPPKQGSAALKAEVVELFEFQKNRKSEDCDQANIERLASLASFFGANGSPISKSDLEQLTTFFKQIRVDVAFVVRKLKHDFARKRPFLELAGLEPCLPKEVGESYPSGHAALSKIYALILGELYPNHRTFLESRAKEIADHRVLAGLHYRTDVEAGVQAAALIYEQLKKSPKFQEDLAKNQKQLALRTQN